MISEKMVRIIGNYWMNCLKKFNLFIDNVSIMYVFCSKSLFFLKVDARR